MKKFVILLFGQAGKFKNLFILRCPAELTLVAEQAAEIREQGGMTVAEVEEFLEVYDRELVGYTYLEAL